MKITQDALQKITNDLAAKKSIHEAAFRIETADGKTILSAASSTIFEEKPFYIASINKLFVAALIFQLKAQTKLNLDDYIKEYLPHQLIQGIHVFKGIDYTEQITIRHLLSHTSGLPCYLIDKMPDNNTLMDTLKEGHDLAIPTHKAMQYVREMQPKFKPGEKRKANYTNTNYHLLAEVVSVITGYSVDNEINRMMQELGMSDSFIIQNDNYYRIIPVRFQQTNLKLQNFFHTSLYDIASTTADLMKFIKAYLGGGLFPKKQLEEMQDWRKIFFPFKYGMGLQMFYIPWILAPFQHVPQIIGHCGSVGTVAFHIPEKDVYLTGTINQSAKPQLAFQALMKIVRKL
ncbi:MAG: class A beta-lactamase-related serine hydrolase [Chitinophagaceae bacterium]|nr:MAG: class A beta-lactamase-related serine hydrolase [Chitinophagaceae bacterium]